MSANQLQDMHCCLIIVPPLGAEFLARASSVQNAIWLKRLLEHLRVLGDYVGSIVFYCDIRQ